MKIGIDPGHGGCDIGAAYKGVLESVTNLAIGKLLVAELETLGFETLLVRKDDRFITHGTRGKKTVGCDLVICVHCNAWTDWNVFGFESYYWPIDPYGVRKRLGECLNVESGRGKTRLYKVSQEDWRRNAYNVIGCHQSMAVLVECGYLSNAKERKFLNSEEGKLCVVKGIAKGIVRWKQGEGL